MQTHLFKQRLIVSFTFDVQNCTGCSPQTMSDSKSFTIHSISGEKRKQQKNKKIAFHQLYASNNKETKHVSVFPFWVLVYWNHLVTKFWRDRGLNSKEGLYLGNKSVHNWSSSIMYQAISYLRFLKKGVIW